jgi:peptidoglycan-N-acetylglucosamine deacetylase
MRRRSFLGAMAALYGTAAGCAARPASVSTAEAGRQDPYTDERAPVPSKGTARKIAITIDDPALGETPLLSAAERDAHLRAALRERNVRAALFVCGKRVDSPQGSRLLGDWNDDGHILGNHSYSHLFLHDADVFLERYVADIDRCEQLLAGRSGFRRLFRYPFLKEGDTREKRDGVRDALTRKQYGVGHVTIDGSDWYIDQRMGRRLAADPSAPLGAYREYLLRHVLHRARFYDGIAQRVVGRSVTHTLLLHHSLLNALFLGDVIDMLQAEGFSVVPAEEAFRDPVFSVRPDVLPAGESLLWAMARATGRFDDVLRYPGEDSSYEREAMDALGL